MKGIGLMASFIFVMFFASPIQAEELPVFNLVLENQQFTPADIVVPAKQKFKVVVQNNDATEEEFDSSDLNREKVIAGKGKEAMFFGPLKPGRYEFFGELHADTAHGVITVKAL